MLGAARDFVDLEKSSLDRSMQQAAPYAAGRLLDVGCGDKPYAATFAPYVTEYIGIEYAETYGDSVNAIKGKADLTYSGDRLPFDDGTFDTVLCNQVGEHVPDPRVFFDELVRLLRVDGRLLFTVPFSFRIHSEPYDFHRFTKYALADYANRAGLHIDVLSARGGFWTVIGQKLTSHLALHWAALGGDIQKSGGFGYEKSIKRKPRYWTLLFVAPAIVAIAAVSRVLDRVERDESDTIGYLLIATKTSKA
jgi:SAM-dependent methyltransferase